MSQNQRVSIQNASMTMRIVLVEPWGREFLLPVDEKLEVTARAASADASFRLVESVNRTVVYAEGYSTVRVIKDGVSHNLDLEAIAGATAPQVLPGHRMRDPLWDRDLDG